MPCRDPDWDIAQLATSELREAAKHINKLTAMLCKMCEAVDGALDILNKKGTIVNGSGVMILEQPGFRDVRIWWDKQQEADAARLAAEEACMQQYKIKLAAWNKLTAPERVALGIKKPVKGE